MDFLNKIGLFLLLTSYRNIVNNVVLVFEKDGRRYESTFYQRGHLAVSCQIVLINLFNVFLMPPSCLQC